MKLVNVLQLCFKKYIHIASALKPRSSLKSPSAHFCAPIIENMLGRNASTTQNDSFIHFYFSAEKYQTSEFFCSTV